LLGVFWIAILRIRRGVVIDILAGDRGNEWDSLRIIFGLEVGKGYLRGKSENKFRLRSHKSYLKQMNSLRTLRCLNYFTYVGCGFCKFSKKKNCAVELKSYSFMPVCGAK
jgi:hypothetical protein